GLWAIIDVGNAKNNIDPTIIRLRPIASESMPKNGDMIAIAITVAPTVIPACTSVADKSIISTGNTACTEYTCKNANIPIKPMVDFNIHEGALSFGEDRCALYLVIFIQLLTRDLTMLYAMIGVDN